MTHSELRRIERTLAEIPFPKKFAVEVTAHCNLACAMCHHPRMCRPKGRMPFELWRRCADQVAAAVPGTDCWFSFCGEPLLEPERVIAMIRYGKQVGLRSLNVNTNGMPLLPEIAGPLLDSGVDLIVIGIDGLAKETSEAIRIGSVHEQVYANVEHLLATRARRNAGAEIQVQFIEMEENEDELEPFRAYWLERGATVKVRKKLSWGGQLETSLCLPEEKRIPCPWALTMMHVFWDGRVPRCPGDTEGDEAVGNAWDEPLELLWKRLGDYRTLHLEHRFDELPERCHTCKDWMVGAAFRTRPGTPTARASGV